mmetsp:Transcript_28181/g.65616  ORF Transcript_28181/g.65616 Transcript_28181/m.65616 type:complete len:320 (+) Transcript_28181:3-962(+)
MHFCSPPKKSPCHSFLALRSSALSGWSANVALSRSPSIGRSVGVRNVEMHDSSAVTMRMLRASYAVARSDDSVASSRSPVSMSSRTSAGNTGESAFGDRSSVASSATWLERWWIAQQSFSAVPASDLGIARMNWWHSWGIASWLKADGANSQMREMVHADEFFTRSSGSSRYLTRKFIISCTMSCSLSESGPSMMEPNAMTAASRRRQFGCPMFSFTNAITACTTSSATTVATATRHEAASVDLLNESSSWPSSCMVMQRSSTGTRYVDAPLTKLWHSESSISSYSTSHTSCQKPMAARATSSGCVLIDSSDISSSVWM